MNVLHIDEQGRWRGGERQAAWLIQGLLDRGHGVVLAGKPDSAFLNAGYLNHEVMRIAAPFRGETDLFTAFKLARVIRDRQIDIIHAHTSHAHTAACLAQILARSGKTVVTRRVAFEPDNHLLNRWKYRRPDRIVPVSQRVADVLREFGVPLTKLAVVHSAVDPKRMEVAPVPRGEIGVPASGPLIGTAGALVDHKDHTNFIATVALVRREFPDLHAVIAGEGELRPTLEKQIADLGLRDVVKLLGRREDAPRVIRALDVYVSSSWSEGLGTSILEALVAQVPVVAANAGGAAEMIKDGETGFLVPVRDSQALASAVARMLREKERARLMAAAGRALVFEQFTVERMVEGYLEVYRGLLSGTS